MDPSSPSIRENISEVIGDGLPERELGMDKELETDLTSSSAAAADCEDLRGGDAQEEFGQKMDPSLSSNCEEIVDCIGDGLAREESRMDASSTSPSDGDADEELRMDLIRAAIEGNVQIFDMPNLSDEHFFRKTREDNNILHIAVRYEKRKFIKAFLEKYFAINKKHQLITERNSQGDTPLHVAAEVGNFGIVELLIDYMKEKPWRAQNTEGNTALHVALLYANYPVARFLVKKDGGLAAMVNNSQEAPLHLAITHLHPFYCKFMMSDLLEKASCVATWRDAKGLTPLLRAASLHPSDILSVIKKIIDVCPESTLVCNTSGKSFLHLLIHNKIFDHLHKKNLNKGFKFNHKSIEDLICLKEITILKDHRDQDGNTPLHIALKCKNILMVKSLLSKCSADPNITNKDGISPTFMIEQLNLWHEVEEPRTLTREESSSAIKGDINFLQERLQRTSGFKFYVSQDSEGSNLLHLLMNTKTEHHYLSSFDDCSKFLDFIKESLFYFPKLVCQTNKTGNTPLHILAQNNDFCKTLVNPLGDPILLSKLLSICADAITEIESRRTTTNESDNHDQLPWVMPNADGNTPLHEAIIANNKLLVLSLLSYSEESVSIVNKHKETPLHLLAATDIGMEEFMVEEIMEMVKANSKALGLQDKDGLTPISRAIKAKNLNVVVTLLCHVQEFSNTNGQTLWKIFLQNQSSDFLDELLQNEAFRMMLEQKNKVGNTPLHIAIQEKCFGFVQNLLETWGSEREFSEDNQWLMDLLRIPNSVGETPEDLLADLPTIPKKLEDKLLTDPRMRGIRSSWGIPRTQLQNYMSSMNVIAALQTTITFTAAFTVPGGLNQDIGTPILLQRISFQVFMISDVIAMCLSMMVLICLLWMVATNKRESVMIQDFALTLLLASFVATLLTFMTGVYATIYPAKPWIAITTLVLCSLLMLFLHRYMLTKLLLLSKYHKGRFVKKFSQRAHSSNTQEQRSDSAV